MGRISETATMVGNASRLAISFVVEARMYSYIMYGFQLTNYLYHKYVVLKISGLMSLVLQQSSCSGLSQAQKNESDLLIDSGTEHVTYSLYSFCGHVCILSFNLTRSAYFGCQIV